MGIGQLISAVKEAGLRLAVIMLALILVMIVASRSVEYELEQEALNNSILVTETAGSSGK